MTLSKARITGGVYLLYFPIVIFAAALVGHAPVALSDAANLIANAYYVVVTLFLYQMFKPVNRNLALLAVLISVVGCTVQSLTLFHLASLQIALAIFGLFNLTIGCLILRSTFLPRTLGVLMALSGLGWLMLLLPELSKPTTMGIEILGIVAEGSLMLWLLVMGVNVQRWNEQAGVTAA
jgi:hypothetical protein